VLLEVAAVDLVHLADGGADGSRGGEHGAHRPKILLRVARFEPLAEQAHDPLGERQIAGGEEGKEALSPLFQHVHLAEG
jgi:hypothetical protein